MTRAEDRLFLSRADRRPWRGQVREMSPSPFLADIETALTEATRADAPARRAENRQLNLFT